MIKKIKIPDLSVAQFNTIFNILEDPLMEIFADMHGQFEDWVMDTKLGEQLGSDELIARKKEIFNEV